LQCSGTLKPTAVQLALGVLFILPATSRARERAADDRIKLNCRTMAASFDLPWPRARQALR
jgi:hypothetical protein